MEWLILLVPLAMAIAIVYAIVSDKNSKTWDPESKTYQHPGFYLPEDHSGDW